VIDYGKARLDDPDWWRRHYILLSGLAREDDFKIQRSIFDFHRALMGNSGLTEDSFKSAQDHARDSFYDIIGSLRPWEGGSAQERKAKEVEDLRSAWFEAFGVDPNDKEWEAKQEARIAEFNRKVEEDRANAPESDMERVLRRMAEKAEEAKVLRRRLRRRRITRQGSKQW